MKAHKPEHPPAPFTPTTSVADLMRDWPQTIPVFLHFHMDCIGCKMAAFEKVSDAAHIYGVPIDLFFDSLLKVIPFDKSTGQ